MSDLKEEAILDEHVKSGVAGAYVEPELGRTDSGSFDGVEYDEHDGKMARRKVDLCLVSTLTLYYFLSYLDRSNLGNAKVAGLTTDLGMTGTDYNLALTSYFIPYILFEYPLAISLKKIGPHILLPSLVSLWGIVTLCQGFITTFSGLIACRFFLGMLEAGLTPCSVIIISMYVRRFELQKRIAVFFAMISLAGAFAGLIAYGLTSQLTGRYGHAGWKWIFWVEGAITCFFPIVTFHMIPKSPRHAWWLKPRERAALLAGLAADNSAYQEAHEEHDHFKALNIFVTNPIVPFYIILNACGGFFTNGLPYFIPPIIAGLGYSSVRAQLFTVPPYAVAFCLALIGAYIGDKTRRRSWVLASCGVMGTAGYALYFSTANTDYDQRYGSLFLIIGGSGPLSASVSAWGLSNMSPHIRRATLIACGFMTSNTISLASVWSFRESEAPRYVAGSNLGMTAAVLLLVLPLTASTIAYFQNKKRDRKMSEMSTGHAWPEGPIADTDVRFRYSF